MPLFMMLIYWLFLSWCKDILLVQYIFLARAYCVKEILLNQMFYFSIELFSEYNAQLLT